MKLTLTEEEARVLLGIIRKHAAANPVATRVAEKLELRITGRVSYIIHDDGPEPESEDPP